MNSFVFWYNVFLLTNYNLKRLFKYFSVLGQVTLLNSIICLSPSISFLSNLEINQQYRWFPELLARRFLSVTQEITIPDYVKMVSDEFANSIGDLQIGEISCKNFTIAKVWSVLLSACRASGPLWYAPSASDQV